MGFVARERIGGGSRRSRSSSTGDSQGCGQTFVFLSILAVSGLVIWALLENRALLITAGIAAIATAGVVIALKVRKRRFERRVLEYLQMLESLPDNHDERSLELVSTFRTDHEIPYDRVREKAQEVLQALAWKRLEGIADETGVNQATDAMWRAVSAVELSGADSSAVARDLYQRVVWQLLSDQSLAEVEERVLARLKSELRIPDADVSEETWAIDEFRRVRKMMLTPELPVIATSTKLQRGEVCHYKTSGSIVDKRVKRSYVVAGERVKEEEWVTVRTGDLYVTSKRVLLVGDGATDVNFSKILDVEVDVDQGLISITKDGRKEPIYINAHDSIYTGHLIERAARQVK